MARNKTESAEFIVYIIYDKSKYAGVYISCDGKLTFEEQSVNHARIVFFERFGDKTKALRRKRYLTHLNESDRHKLIKKHNPEMLNLIFTIYDNELLTTK